ncbi:MAG: DUF1822 family protein [Cyanobacteria bacterium J06632_3]
MIDATVNADWLENFSTLSIHAVDLPPEVTAEAANTCQDIEDGQTQWQSFLDLLAVAGVEQWLNQGGHTFAIARPKKQPPKASTHFKVGNYRISVISTGSMSDTQIDISVRLDPARQAHLYILAEVREEIDQVLILAGLRQEQLLSWVNSQNITLDITPESDRLSFEARSAKKERLLTLPATLFKIEPEQILLQLSCLEPAATPVASVSSEFSDISTRFVNTKRWLQDQLDQILDELNWALLPPLVTSSSLRPVRTTLDTVMEMLLSKDIIFPLEARGAGGTITIGDDVVCQLYTWAWPVENVANPEWSLFVLLAPELSDELPAGIQLQLSDETEVLATECLSAGSDETYLYVQAQGSQDETFTVRVVSPSGENYSLPAFSFT